MNKLIERREQRIKELEEKYVKWEGRFCGDVVQKIIKLDIERLQEEIEEIKGWA